jgi:hypothetical protein
MAVSVTLYDITHLKLLWQNGTIVACPALHKSNTEGKEEREKEGTFLDRDNV